jgi:hypothetical protein
LAILVNVGVVFYSLYNKNSGHPAALASLNIAFNFVLHFTFIGAFRILMTPWWCDSLSQLVLPFLSNGQL